MRHSSIVLLIVVLVFHNIGNGLGSKILSVAFMSSKSHKITYDLLLKTLGERGHDVTVLSPIVPGKKESKNVKEVLTFDVEKWMEKMPDFFDMKEKGEQMNPFAMIDEFSQLCRDTYELPQVKEIMNQKFDLVIWSAIFNECAAGLVHKLNTSVILVSPAVTPPWVGQVFGNPSPTSFVPNLFLGYSDKMTFSERLINFVTSTMLDLLLTFKYKPAMEKLYREMLNDPSLPSHDEVLRNASLVLSNSHFSLGTPRPTLPDNIAVGGMHCRPAKPLPKELEDFVKSSGDDGFILFSMGSALKGSMMPEKKRKMILGAFARLKQKVLWKWETETMPDLPPNVKLSKWLPQQDVLGHPKIKAFITHGGFGSTTEAVYHGVPLVGIPMFGDQDLNMQRSEASGFAVTLQYNDFTEQDLLNALNTVITEPKYKENVMRLSSLFRDQPQKPLDRALFWVEYVLRHKGAPQLRSAARDLNFFQYHSLDVIGFLFSIISIVLYVIFALLRFIFRKLCNSPSTKKVKNVTKKRN